MVALRNDVSEMSARENFIWRESQSMQNDRDSRECSVNQMHGSGCSNLVDLGFDRAMKGLE
jgi:hypothetical protein